MNTNPPTPDGPQLLTLEPPAHVRHLLQREWGCLPVGVGVAPAVEGGWRWLALTGRGEVWEGLERKASRQRSVNLALTRLLGGSPWCATIAHVESRVVRFGANAREHPQAAEAEAASTPLGKAARRLLTARHPVMDLPAHTGWNGYSSSKPHRSGRIKGFDPYLVATDASWSENAATWGCATGGGWYVRGQKRIAGPFEAELRAVGRGLLLYPADVGVTVISDNVQVCEMIARLQQGEPLEKLASPDKHPDRAANLKLVAEQLQRLGEVRVTWVKRNTHPLHAQADFLANDRLKNARSAAEKHANSRGEDDDAGE